MLHNFFDQYLLDWEAVIFYSKLIIFMLCLKLNCIFMLQKFRMK